MRCRFIKQVLLIVIACLANSLSSCNNNLDEHSVVADLTSTTRADLFVIGKNVQLIPLPRECAMGEVTYAKIMGNNYFFYDESRRCIYFVRDDGSYIEFNKLGRGPGEYTDIGSFAIIEPEQELALFERHTRRLRFYSLTDFTEVRSQELDYYINALDYIGNGDFLMFREGRSDYTNAIIRFNTKTKEEEELLPLREDQIMMAEDFVLSKNGDIVLFGISGPNTKLYQFGKNLQTVATVSFVPDKLGRSYWRGDFSDRKQKELLLAMQDGGEGIALGPCDVSLGENGCFSFWFFVKRGTVAHVLPKRHCCVVRNGEAYLYESISCKALGIDSLQPIASSGSRTLTLLTQEEISPQHGTVLGDQFLEMKNKGYNYFLLAYELF